MEEKDGAQIARVEHIIHNFAGVSVLSAKVLAIKHLSIGTSLIQDNLALVMKRRLELNLMLERSSANELDAE